MPSFGHVQGSESGFVGFCFFLLKMLYKPTQIPKHTHGACIFKLTVTFENVSLAVSGQAPQAKVECALRVCDL